MALMHSKCAFEDGGSRGDCSSIELLYETLKIMEWGGVGSSQYGLVFLNVC